jgi:catechol 2,3-dioxygenase-like lactoylglutathione lyase family enzyme
MQLLSKELTMTDHVSIPVSDIKKSCEFYDKSLSCLGYSRVADVENDDVVASGYMRKDKPAVEFWLFKSKNPSDKPIPEQAAAVQGLHIGFGSSDKEGVQEWHKTCLECGGTDNGGPGLRYPGHYSAYIIDPDGWHMEACCHSD